MANLIIGVGEIGILVRHSRSLKDKRQVMKGLVQKLRNLGFSATESDFLDDTRRGGIGYAFLGTHVSGVRKMLEESRRLAVGNFEVTFHAQDLLDFDPEQSWEENALLAVKGGDDEEDDI